MTEKEKLEKIITVCNEAYWNGKEPPVDDIAYDRLVRKLEEIDPENPLVTGLPKPEIKGKKVVHEKPMLSLAKAYSLEEVLKWCRKVARSENEVFKIQPKYDGLSGLLDRNGVLSSRGDGKTGEDYSAKLPFIKFEGKAREDGTWLGEMLITNEDFRYMKAAGLKGKSGAEFKNQRNAVAGLVGADDLEYLAGLDERMKPSGHSLITFVDYELRSWYVELCDLEERWEEVKGLILKSGYPMDGIVIKLADQEYADSLGATEHHPKGAVAFKFTNQTAWSVLREVEWTMGKEQIAAVGIIDPVDISGSTIRRVKLQLTRPVASEVRTFLMDGSLQIGDEVLVEKAGDIIPHVVQSRPGGERRLAKLEKCPFCGSSIEIGSTYVTCKNPGCPRRKIEKLKFALAVLGFKGVAEAYAAFLFEILGVDSVEKLMQVQEKDLRAHREFGDKNVDIFLNEQEKARKSEALNVLTAMDMPSIGKNTGKLLLESFGLERLLTDPPEESGLLEVKGIGKVAAKEISQALKENSEEIKRTLKLFNLKEPEKKPEGDTVCFTGKMSKTRGEMEKTAAEAGLIPVDHVDKNTKILVCADPSSGSSKMQKAKKLGCRILSEAEYFDLILNISK